MYWLAALAILTRSLTANADAVLATLTVNVLEPVAIDTDDVDVSAVYPFPVTPCTP
jgi:hypothetical protein